MFKIEWEKTSAAMISEEIIYKMSGLAFPEKTLTLYEVIKGGCVNINIKIYLSKGLCRFILRIYLRDKKAVHREQKLGLLLKDIVPAPTLYYIGDTR